MKKQKLAGLTVLIIAVLFFNSCLTISYAPLVSLDVSPHTIKKTLMVEKFTDKSPVDDRKSPFLGHSVTNEKALANDLSLEVTNAIISDLSNNSCFKEVRRRIDNPDFILKGEIKQFKGKNQLTQYGLISFCTIVGVMTWYFGMPIQFNQTEIELQFSLYDNKGNLVGVYAGKNSDKMRFNMYNNNSLALASQTNRSLSVAVSAIRTQIMKDITKYE